MIKKKLDELQRDNIQQFKQKDKAPIVVVLDSVRSALNVGSFFRTCDAFAIEKLVLTGISACPPHKEITKTAIGATESVEWVFVEEVAQALQQLKAEGYQLVGIEQTDASIEMQTFEVQPDKKYALVFGNEVEGVSDAALAALDTCIEIPQFGTKHSLNVSVCGGIVIYYFANQYFR